MRGGVADCQIVHEEEASAMSIRHRSPRDRSTLLPAASPSTTSRSPPWLSRKCPSRCDRRPRGRLRRPRFWEEPAKAEAFNAMERRRDPSTVEFRTLPYLRRLPLGDDAPSRPFRRSASKCRRAHAASVSEPHAATRSIKAGSSSGAFELFTRLDTGHLCNMRR
jgi:hypothetical protein